MAGDARTIPAPVVSPETEAFWAAAREGRFLLRWCTACERTHWYPRAVCPFCLGTETEWREASGEGAIYAYSAMRRAPQVFVVAYVTLREGPTMLTNICNCDPDALAIGQPVRVVFTPTEGGPPVPMFTPL
jgi:uncharacterized protein